LIKQPSSSQDDGPIRFNISEEAKDLVKRILNPNPRKRFTIEQIMLHPWMHMNFEEGSFSD